MSGNELRFFIEVLVSGAGLEFIIAITSWVAILLLALALDFNLESSMGGEIECFLGDGDS